ncbi:MAG: pilin [Gammaproteobacteria bacterium]|nr:pilin [Gammaproteobacteria bacterium]
MMKKILIALITLITLIILLFIFQEIIDQPSPQRLAAMGMQSCSYYIQENHITNKDLDGSCQAMISDIRYEKDGEIALYNQKYQLYLTYTPKNTNGKIEWLCRGEPKKYFPKQCR